MPKYHCPFCSPLYQFHKQRSDGVMICGLCDEPLLKTPFIKATQILALMATSAFVLPFIFLAITSLKDLNKPEPELKTGQLLPRKLTINNLVSNEYRNFYSN